MVLNVTFEFNDIISLYTINDSEQRRAISLWYYLVYIWWYYCELSNIYIYITYVLFTLNLVLNCQSLTIEYFIYF